MRWRCPISRKSRFLLLVCGTTFVGLSLTIYLPPAHYSAALTAAVYALVLQAMRSLRLWRPEGRRQGSLWCEPFLSSALPCCRCAQPRHSLEFHLPATAVHTWYSADFHNLERARILKQLQNESGQHLVLVRYSFRS